MFTRRRVLAVVAAAAAIAAVIAGCGLASGDTPARYPYQGAAYDQPQPRNPIVIDYFGDSVLGQAGPMLTTLAAERNNIAVIHALSGGAPCNAVTGEPLGFGAHVGPTGPRYTQVLSAEIAAGRKPTWVAIAYVGNAKTNCMLRQLHWSRMPGVLNTAQRAAIAKVYRADILRMIAFNKANGIKTSLILPLYMGRGTFHGQLTKAITDIETQIANALVNVGTNAGPRNILSINGRFTEFLSVNGATKRVRFTDLTHLELPFGQMLYATYAYIPLILP